MTQVKLLLITAFMLAGHTGYAASIAFNLAECPTSCRIQPDSEDAPESAFDGHARAIDGKIKLVLPTRLNGNPLAKPLLVEKADLNFDGHADILVSETVSTNRAVHAWIFSPETQQFSYAGEAPPLKIDPLKKQLYTASKGADNGSFVTTIYKIQNGQLTPTLSEQAEPTQQNGIYKKTRYQIENGQAKLLKVEFAYGASGL
ncbi:MAG TPA: hypothetical protein VFM46_15475 [Pseudomonadales bacterium]|nr:hypothetical protein [Pseudomonadales bacterium]